jgi:hypothetical protein
VGYKSYPFYVVTPSGRVAAGYEYREDAKDFAREHKSFNLTVVPRATLKRRGKIVWNKGSDLSGRRRGLGSATYADSVEQYKRGTNAAKAMTAAYNGNCVEAKKLIKKALHEPKKTPLKVYAAAYKIVAGRCGLPMRGTRSRRRRR